MPTFMENVARNWKDFKKFVWDVETNEFLGRTGFNWIQVLIFFTVFYIFLFSFLVLLIFARVSLLPDVNEGPYRNDYLTHDGPGLKVVPYGQSKEFVYKYRRLVQTDYQYYIDRITDFFSDYQSINGTDRTALFQQCVPQQEAQCGQINDDDRAFEYFDAVAIPNTNVKAYNIYNLGDCYFDFGFKRGEPCFYLTINKAWNWMPSLLSPGSRKDENWVELVDNLNDNFTPLVCRGLKEKDRDMISAIEVYPKLGFRRDYFPWKGQPFYRSPIVAVQVKVREDIGYNRDVRVECLILADNIFHQGDKRRSAGRVVLTINVQD